MATIKSIIHSVLEAFHDLRFKYFSRKKTLDFLPSWKPPSPEPNHVAVATCSQLQPLEKFLTENPTCHLMDGCLSADI